MILLSALLGVAPTYYYYISAFFLVVFAFIMIRRESRRRFFVALKRKPQSIPLVMVTCCFIWYSFKMTPGVIFHQISSILLLFQQMGI